MLLLVVFAGKSTAGPGWIGVAANGCSGGRKIVDEIRVIPATRAARTSKAASLRCVMTDCSMSWLTSVASSSLKVDWKHKSNALWSSETEFARNCSICLISDVDMRTIDIVYEENEVVFSMRTVMDALQ